MLFVCKSCTFGSVFRQVSRGWMWSFCRFYGCGGRCCCTRFLPIYRSPSHSNAHQAHFVTQRRTGERSIDRTKWNETKNTKLYEFLLLLSSSSSFFMGILMNFVCLRRASIWMNWVFLLLSVFISFKWHGCLEIAMNDAPAKYNRSARERERDIQQQ